jgi:hypothetical protein
MVARTCGPGGIDSLVVHRLLHVLDDLVGDVRDVEARNTHGSIANDLAVAVAHCAGDVPLQAREKVG